MNDFSALQVNNAHRPKDFFLARQPILNRDQKLIAYELLFRDAASGPANVSDDRMATAAVIAHTSELGIDNVIGDSLGFVNVDASVLMSDFIRFLPADKVVLEILETVEVTPAIVQRVADLNKAGFTFALDDVVADSEGIKQLLPYVKIIKIDLMNMPQSTLFKLSGRFKMAQKTLLAEKVETVDEFNRCLDLGFEYFQGYYFAKPAILSGKKLSPSQLAVMQLMAMVVTDSDTTEIERCVKQDASLGLTLLRMVNTPAMGVTQRIDSIGQALVILGRRQLHRWLQILLYAEPDKNAKSSSPSPLLVMATTRGRLLELLAQKAMPENRNVADIAFTIGIMSLMDALFALPMQEILKKISVVDEVADALLHRRGLYGDMLTLVEHIERLSDDAAPVLPLLEKLNLSIDDLNRLQLNAYEWSNDVSRAAH